jgi:hypothetical protein
MGEIRNAYKVVIGHSEVKRALERHAEFGDNIKEINIKRLIHSYEDQRPCVGGNIMLKWMLNGIGC